MENLKSLIIKSLYFKSPQSIAEVGESLHRSVPHITKSLNELLEQGYLTDQGQAPSTGGRRAMQYSLNQASFPAIIAVAIDQFYINTTLFDLAKNRLSPIRSCYNNLNNNPDSLKLIKEQIAQLLEAFPDQPILAIGITQPGFVDSSAGVNYSYTTADPLFNLRQEIEREFTIPTYIENDSSAIAIAEQKFGQAQHTAHVMVVNLNWGVGLGMIINHQLFRGNNGYAGEFSHIPLSNTNQLCSCGKTGCLEVEASITSALEFVRQQVQQGESSMLTHITAEKGRIQLNDFIHAYEQGDQLAIRSIKSIAYMLGKGIATLIHIMNPEKIIISGRGAIFGDILCHQIQSAVQEFCIPRLSKYTTISISAVDHPQLLGSASIALENSTFKL